LGIGVAQLPRLASKVGAVMALKGQGSSRGGPLLALPVPAQFLLYPEAVRVADLQAVVNSPSVADLTNVVAAGPRESYLAQKGCVKRPTPHSFPWILSPRPFLNLQSPTRGMNVGEYVSIETYPGTRQRRYVSLSLSGNSYLTYGAFAAALPANKFNPLAVKVVFDNLNSCQVRRLASG
jgi:hypothetical protein